MVKTQIKGEVERIIQSLTIQIMFPLLGTQPGILSKVQQEPTLFSYAAVLQKEAESGPEIESVVLLKNNKCNYIVLFVNPDPEEF